MYKWYEGYEGYRGVHRGYTVPGIGIGIGRKYDMQYNMTPASTTTTTSGVVHRCVLPYPLVLVSRTSTIVLPVVWRPGRPGASAL